ncbi:MAG: response regulator [Pseudomonadota bacterium]
MKKILIVEDDQKISLAMQVRLKLEGYEVDQAYDAVSGLSMCSQLQPDLVLLDISLPGGNGFELAHRVKSLVVIPPDFIIITALKDAGLREKAMQLGAIEYFEKPYDGGRLLSTIWRWYLNS